MALPAIADVRRAMPDASLVVAARPAIAPLFSMVPGIDEVVLHRVAKRGRHSRDALFDAAILLPNSFQVALTAWRAGSARTWGYRTDWRGPLLTRAIDPPTGVHQVEYYQHLVRALGFQTVPDDGDPSPFRVSHRS